MTTHVYHEDILTHGFCDECPRCQGLVDYFVFEADATLFMKYWDMTQRFLERGGGYDECKSDLDIKVLRMLEEHIDRQKRIEERLARVAA
jgi:hypothetical protein